MVISYFLKGMVIMKRVAIVTDSTSGISQREAKDMGIFVLPMSFNIDNNIYYEGMNLSAEDFFAMQSNGSVISTTAPSPGELLAFWEKILREYEKLVYIPLTSGLSSACNTADILAQHYNGRVLVVDNHRVSVPLKQAVCDALNMLEENKTAEDIHAYLEKDGPNSSIYITLNTLEYLKKGGRLTPAVAAIGEVLGIKPVLQIQGGKLDIFSKCRGLTIAKKKMLKAIENDMKNRFANDVASGNIALEVAYSGSLENALEWKSEVESYFSDYKVDMAPLALNICCHTGAGALGVGCTRKYK